MKLPPSHLNPYPIVLTPMAAPLTDPTADGPSVYVDEKIGSDENGDGTIQKPYQSAAQAIVNYGASPPLNILTRKSETDEWALIGISALKKARKGAEGIEKKKKKAEEAAVKAAEKAVEHSKVKDVVIEEDTSLPTAVKVTSLFGFSGNSHPFRRQRSST